MKFRVIIIVLLTNILPTTVSAQVSLIDSLCIVPETVGVTNVPDSIVLRNIDKKSDLVSVLQDSIVALQLYIRNLEDRQKQYIRQIAYADTCIVRQANNALNAPYDEKRIHSALQAFDRINSSDYREQMSSLRQLLVDYGRYYKELIDILKRADTDRNLRNPFSGKDVAEQYIEEIHHTDYSQNVMQKEWVIPFMNRLTEKAVSRLKANNPAERHIIDLKEFLIP